MNSQKLILLSAPSGSGKTTIIKFLMQRNPLLSFSISATTRPKRAGEEHAKDYYYLSEENFKQQIEEGLFLEWEMVYSGLYYGTYKSEIKRIQQLNLIPILDLDVVGGINTKQIYKQHCCSIFIYVPDTDQLRKRLLDRGMPDDNALNERIEKAKLELDMRSKFDFCVQNIDINRACAETQEIVEKFIHLS